MMGRSIACPSAQHWNVPLSNGPLTLTSIHPANLGLPSHAPRIEVTQLPNAITVHFISSNVGTSWLGD